MLKFLRFWSGSLAVWGPQQRHALGIDPSPGRGNVWLLIGGQESGGLGDG